MAYDLNDWSETAITQIKVAPIVQNGQRIKDINSSNQTIEVKKKGLNFTNEFVGYYDGTQFVHYIQCDGDAQLQWNNSVNQISKDTKYNLNLNRVNNLCEIDFFIELSSADDPRFKIYSVNDVLLATFNLIDAGNTNVVVGTVRIVKINSLYVITAIYSYLKNTIWYHENQSSYISTQPAKISFSCGDNISYSASSYAKITNK